MGEKKFKEVQHKITDYKNFSLVLLVLSIYLAMGSLIPFEGRTGQDQLVLSSAAVVALLSSIFFHRKVLKLKDQQENEDM
ncbi:MAG TPA: YrhC family protein [Bacillales bacterium]|nr:YrhC family protein [Bacillales bacterium]